MSWPAARSLIEAYDQLRARGALRAVSVTNESVGWQIWRTPAEQLVVFRIVRDANFLVQSWSVFCAGVAGAEENGLAALQRWLAAEPVPLRRAD